MSCAQMRAESGATQDGPGSITEDAVLGGALRLRQPRRGHRVGHDAVLLAAACPAHAGEQLVDLGAGVGAAGLAVATRAPGVAVTLVEIDPDLAALAAENAELNGLAGRVTSLNLDVAAPARAFAAAGLAPERVDRVLTNPPFNDPVRQRASPDRRRRLAHAAPREALGVWIRTAARLLRPDGTLTLIFRADGLADLGHALAAGFGAVTVLPIYPKPDQPAVRILVRATKASRAPLVLLPGLVLNDALSQPTPQAEAVLRAGLTLPLAET
jgi:tRNA1(Val) A37 N6-methylase TrmN6